MATRKWQLNPNCSRGKKRKWLKKWLSRWIRRWAKQDPEGAPTKKVYRGFD